MLEGLHGSIAWPVYVFERMPFLYDVEGGSLKISLRNGCYYAVPY